MTVFKLTCKVTVSAETEVEANTLEEAIEFVSSREIVLGGIGAGAQINDSWIIEDADGSAYDITEA